MAFVVIASLKSLTLGDPGVAMRFQGSFDPPGLQECETSCSPLQCSNVIVSLLESGSSTCVRWEHACTDLRSLGGQFFQLGVSFFLPVVIFSFSVLRLVPVVPEAVSCHRDGSWLRLPLFLPLQK